MWLYLRMWLLLCSYIPIDKFSFQFKEKVYSYAKGQGSKFRLVVVGPLDSDRKKNTGKLSKVEHRLPNPIGTICSMQSPKLFWGFDEKRVNYLMLCMVYTYVTDT